MDRPRCFVMQIVCLLGACSITALPLALVWVTGGVRGFLHILAWLTLAATFIYVWLQVAIERRWLYQDDDGEFPIGQRIAYVAAFLGSMGLSAAIVGGLFDALWPVA